MTPSEYVPRTRKHKPPPEIPSATTEAPAVVPPHPAPQQVATATKRMEDRATVGDALQIAERAGRHFAHLAARQAVRAQWVAAAALVLGIVAFVLAFAAAVRH